jgi:hypothetical protein
MFTTAGATLFTISANPWAKAGGTAPSAEVGMIKATPHTVRISASPASRQFPDRNALTLQCL